MEVTVTMNESEARRVQGLIKHRIGELEQMLAKGFDKKDRISMAAKTICEDSLRDLTRMRAKMDDAWFRSQEPITR